MKGVQSGSVFLIVQHRFVLHEAMNSHRLLIASLSLDEGTETKASFVSTRGEAKGKLWSSPRAST